MNKPSAMKTYYSTILVVLMLLYAFVVCLSFNKGLERAGYSMTSQQLETTYQSPQH